MKRHCKEANVMAKSNVSSKDASRQEPIKHFNCGVVSWGLFDKVWHENDELRKKLRFLLTNSDLDWGLNIIHDLIDLSEKNADELWEKAKTEKQQATSGEV
jgi:hypothetical protein